MKTMFNHWTEWEKQNCRAIVVYKHMCYFDDSPENDVRWWAKFLYEWRQYSELDKKLIRENQKNMLEIFRWLSSLLDDRRLRTII